MYSPILIRLNMMNVSGPIASTEVDLRSDFELRKDTHSLKEKYILIQTMTKISPKW